MSVLLEDTAGGSQKPPGQQLNQVQLGPANNRALCAYCVHWSNQSLPRGGRGCNCRGPQIKAQQQLPSRSLPFCCCIPLEPGGGDRIHPCHARARAEEENKTICVRREGLTSSPRASPYTTVCNSTARALGPPLLLVSKMPWMQLEFFPRLWYWECVSTSVLAPTGLAQNLNSACQPARCT